MRVHQAFIDLPSESHAEMVHNGFGNLVLDREDVV